MGSGREVLRFSQEFGALQNAELTALIWFVRHHLQG